MGYGRLGSLDLLFEKRLLFQITESLRERSVCARVRERAHERSVCANVPCARTLLFEFLSQFSKSTECGSYAQIFTQSVPKIRDNGLRGPNLATGASSGMGLMLFETKFQFQITSKFANILVLSENKIRSQITNCFFTFTCYLKMDSNFK